MQIGGWPDREVVKMVQPGLGDGRTEKCQVWIRTRDLETYQSNVLTSSQGLENLTIVGGHLSISWNGALTSFQGLKNLKNVGFYSGIEDNFALTSLQGPENLKTVGGYLEVYGNNTLTSLQGR